MHRTALTTIAPEIFRKRLLVDGHYQIELTAEVIHGFFRRITGELGLRTYGEPIIHRTHGQGRHINEGFDAFVPLIDSGIYVAAWVGPRFLSTILYSCAAFDEDRALAVMREFLQLSVYEAAIF